MCKAGAADELRRPLREQRRHEQVVVRLCLFQCELESFGHVHLLAADIRVDPV
jgi:hypothetical protein